jgi:hypothetical protein
MFLRNIGELLPKYRSHTEWRDSVVGIATGYGLDDRGVGVRVPLGQDFSAIHVVQTDFKAHLAYNPMDTAGSFPGVKAAGA